MHPPTTFGEFGRRRKSAQALSNVRSTDTLADMHIVSALFVENFAMRQAPGPSTRIDLTGAMFSMAAPSAEPV